MSGEKMLPCWHCGGKGMVGEGTWFYVQCTKCSLELGANYDADGNPSGEYWTEDDAIADWNTRVAVTDYDFAKAVHDGELWGKCSECKERQGYYLDAETIQRQQEHIAELEAENAKLWRMNDGIGAELANFGEQRDKAVAERDGLIRDLARRIPWSSAFYDGEWHMSPSDEVLAERIRELGIEV